MDKRILEILPKKKRISTERSRHLNKLAQRRYIERLKSKGLPLPKKDKSTTLKWYLENIDRKRKTDRESQRRCRLRNPEVKRIKDKTYKNRYQHKVYAVNKLNNSIQSGLIKRPEKCSRCISTVNIQGHHPDYNKPLEVIWLCVLCHNSEHKKIRSLMLSHERGEK